MSTRNFVMRFKLQFIKILIMEKMIFVSFLLIFALTSFSQLPFITNETEKRFLSKSKKQNKKAAVYIGIGSLALAAGIPMYTSSSNLDDAVSGLGLSMLGGVCVATGILLFRSSGMNKKRAMSVAVRKQAINKQFKPNNYLSTQTTIVLRINLAK